MKSLTESRSEPVACVKVEATRSALEAFAEGLIQGKRLKPQHMSVKPPSPVARRPSHSSSSGGLRIETSRGRGSRGIGLLVDPQRGWGSGWPGASHIQCPGPVGGLPTLSTPAHHALPVHAVSATQRRRCDDKHRESICRCKDAAQRSEHRLQADHLLVTNSFKMLMQRADCTSLSHPPLISSRLSK